MAAKPGPLCPKQVVACLLASDGTLRCMFAGLSHSIAAAVLALGATGACGRPGPVPALSGEAVAERCESKRVATRCFRVTVTNLGSAEATGECWVAAIHNFRDELGRSDSVAITALGPDQAIDRGVVLRISRRHLSKGPAFPVHCEPGGSD